MLKLVLSAAIFLCLAAASILESDLLRICSADYPGGCSLRVYDYSGSIFDFHALWCGDEMIYESSGLGGKIGSNGNCRYFL